MSYINRERPTKTYLYYNFIPVISKWILYFTENNHETDVFAMVNQDITVLAPCIEYHSSGIYTMYKPYMVHILFHNITRYKANLQTISHCE